MKVDFAMRAFLTCVVSMTVLAAGAAEPQRPRMKISLLTIGAMGDTQPFVALAVRLKAQGHSVRSAARPDFESLAASYGMEFTPLGNPYKLVMRDQEVAAAIGSESLIKMLPT